MLGGVRSDAKKDPRSVEIAQLLDDIHRFEEEAKAQAMPLSLYFWPPPHSSLYPGTRQCLSPSLFHSRFDPPRPFNLFFAANRPALFP